MALATIDSLLAAPGGVRDQRVFVRADLNVPLDDGRVGDEARILASLPTLRRLLAGAARVIVASHLGRPRGERKPALSLRPVAARLAGLLGRGVAFADDCVGPVAERAAAGLESGGVLLLENLRFCAGEEANDPDFARALAALAEVYVNDAFGTAHRAHASTTAMVALVPRVAAGDLLRSELEHPRAVRDPARPLVCLLGGAKVSDKLAVLEALAPHADVLCVGGAMAYTFLRARGEPTGDSLVEPDRIGDATRVMEAAERAGCKLLLPVDHVVARKISDAASHRTAREIDEGWLGVDIGPETARIYAAEVLRAGTVFWNGPMGVFELEPFAEGTESVALAVAESDAETVVGGGDSLAAVNRLGLGHRIGHLSTGGGASLEYVQGLELPGVAALEAHP